MIFLATRTKLGYSKHPFTTSNFIHSSFHISIKRLIKLNSFIGTVRRRRYSYQSLFSVRFAINPETGELTVAAPLDYESTQEYLVGVAANDGAYRAQTTVTIDVLDRNDNAPEFDRAPYRFTVMQGQDVGYSVGTVSATDDDADDSPNGQFFYR